MTIKLKIVLFLVIMFWIPLSASFLTDLGRDIEDGSLDDFTPVEAAFILSGVENPDTLLFCLDWYNELFGKIKSFHLDPFEPVASAQKVFAYLHGTQLKAYQLEATTLMDIIHRKRFNCVSATILYNLLCDELGFSTEAFETPTHVYTLFNNYMDQLMVENTSPMGFNMANNLNAYARHLVHFYSREQVHNIGLDQLYAHEHSNGRIINNTELLGLLAYNQAYFARKKKNYASSYKYVLLAQKFNEDSRSNQTFEINLYQEWGSRLYGQRNFIKAFSVLADGYYRYPENKNLAHNTQITFQQSMNFLWKKKDWEAASQLFYEILDFEWDHTFYSKTLSFLISWEKYLINHKQNGSIQDSKDLIQIYKNQLNTILE